jgi:hypothetical protein
MVALLSTTASDDRLQSGIKNIIPGATFDKDKFGNLVAIAPVYRDGKPTQQYTRFYPNPKGFDVTDAMIGSGAAALGEGIVLTGGLLGLPTSGLLGAAGAGATEAALVEAVSSYLTGAPYKVSDIPAGATGGVIGAKAVSVLGSLVRRFRSSPDAVLDAAGNVRPEIAQQLTDMGIDPQAVTADTMAKILEQTRRAVDPTEARRLAEAQTLPVPVPLTTGAVTGQPAQQLFEDMAYKGSYGEGAASMLAGRRAETQQALRENVPAIQQQIGGGSPAVTELGDAGRGAQSSLSAQRAAASTKANELYATARASGPAFIDEDFGVNFVNSARSQLGDNFEFRNVPMTSGMLDELSAAVSDGGNVRELFAIRQRMTGVASSLGPEGVAAQQLKKIFDDGMTSALNDTLIYGDEAAVAAWKDAISNYKDFASTWKSRGGILNALTEKVGKDGDMVLKVSPDRASNAILGSSSGGLSSNPEMARNLLTLKKNLPQAEWDQIRQEAFVRITNAGKSAVAGEDVFSGVNFRKAWNKTLTDNPTMVKALFSPEERALISQFANVSARATGGAVNSSNSAAAGINVLGNLAAMLGTTNLAQFAMRIAGPKMLRAAYGGTKAFSALSPSVTPPNVGGAGLALGQGATTEEVQDPLAAQMQRTTGMNFAR